MTYELSTCILKMILLYIVILSSVTIQTVKSQGDKDCDCKGFGLVKDLVLQVVMEQRMESAKLSRLEARLKTYETTWPILNDRLKGLEKNLNDINMKFNETVTGTKDKQMGFNRGIGTIVQKALISEKKERKKLVSSMNKIVNEYKDTIETFKEAINNTIDKRFQDISAEQVKYKDTVETFKVAINKTIDKRFQDITAKQADYKATIETYKEAIDNTIDNRFQDITAKQVDYKATIETYKEAINNTIDNRFQDIAAEQREYKNTLETFKVSINKTIDERFEHISANQIKYRNEISLDLITINETRYMVDTLGKIVEGGQVRLVNGSNQYEGRLEVWHDWSWGTVCGDGFDTLSASVVCKMLNFQHTFPRVYGSAQFGAGASLIHLDNVDCKGTETSITQCRHNGWGINDCEHREDVGISCTPGHCKVPFEFDTLLSISDKFHVSLSGGSVVDVDDYVYFNCSKAGDDIHEPVNRRFKCINGEWIEDERDKSWQFGNNGSFPKCRKTKCEPNCENGGVCLRDDQCKCKHLTSGKRCENVICDDECYANDGKCFGPGRCKCPEGKYGANCEQRSCMLPENKDMVKVSTQKTYFAFGETVGNFTCQMGHFPSSDQGMTCRSDGSWSDIVTCVKGKMYIIRTKTGKRPFGGTDANVHITLFGSKGSTRRIDLRGRFGYVAEIRTFARDVRPIQSVQIGHDGGISSDWYLEYVSIYVEDMEEFYVFRNIKQQWVREGSDLTLEREGNRSCINTFGEKYMWYPTWSKNNDFFLGKGSGMSSRSCKQACITWRKDLCNGVYRNTRYHTCYGFSETRDEYFTVQNEPLRGELFFRTCKKFN